MNTKMLLGLLIVSAAWAQEPLNGVRSWKGTIKMVAEGVGAQSSGNVKESWSVANSATLKIKVDWEEKAGWYMGTVVEGRAVNNERITTSTPSNTSTTTYTAETDMRTNWQQQARKFTIYVNSKGQFRLGFIDPIISLTVTRPHDKLVWQSPFYQTRGIDPFITPTNPDHLTGTYELKGRAMFLLSGNADPEFNWKIEYDFVPAVEAEDVEVVVSSATYDFWRPQAGEGGTKGNDITFKAVLQKKGGGVPTVKATTFEWRLPEMSNIPGYAINAPRVNPSNAPDMRFEPSATLTVIGDEAQMADAVPGKLLSSEATIGSYDWGGYGTLEVTAVLEDGRRIKAPALLVPKRAAGDTISKPWRDAYGAGAKADSSDDEDTPIGDGTKGDGLTLYEEYRGFIMNGHHEEGDIHAKDYFILNKGGAPYLPGIQLFEGLTKLKVHYQLKDSEACDGRVINCNHGEAPHAVDQHLVEIRVDSQPRETASAIGGPGNPVMISHVIMPIVTGSEEPYVQTYYARTLAHELMHAVNVWHHGDQPEKKVKWFERDGVVYEANARGQTEKPIRVLKENGSPAALTIPPEGVSIWLGAKHGPHSGVENCVMRYDVSDGYVSDADSDVRYYVSYESTGGKLCDSPVGTGVNDPKRTTPQSRYGDADVGRGKCVRQILVNDAVKAPTR